jgi:AcrR family transcriptional regulator
MVETPWGDSGELRERMLRPGPGTSGDEVARNQRRRLFGATVASVAERGYEATRVADLVEISGVSSRSFYDLFPNKEACFVAAFEAISRAAVAALSQSGDPARRWEDRVADSYGAFAEMLVRQPAAARMCLVEAYAAGPAARQSLDAAVAAFEDLTRDRIAGSPGRTTMPEELVAAHVGALQAIAQTCLLEGKPNEVAALVPDLAKLMLSYRPPPVPLRLTIRPPSLGPESVSAPDDAERALRAFAIVVAERGYGGVTIHEVAKRGSMSPATFSTNFRNKEEALLAAIDSAGAQVVTAAMTAFHRSPDWALGIRAAAGAMLNFLASRPAMAHVLAVEAYAGGAKAIRRRARALSPLAAVLAEGHRAAPDVPGVAGAAIAGAVAALVYKRVNEGGAGSLPTLAPVCTYIALAPFVGAERACGAANSDGRVRAADAIEWEGMRDLLAVQPTKWSVLAILGMRSASRRELARDLDAPAGAIKQYLGELEEEGFVERAKPATSDGPEVWRIRSSFRLMELEEWTRLRPEERRKISAEVICSVEQEISRAVEAGTFDRRPDRHLTRIGFTVDEQGWRELADIQIAAVVASQEVRLKSARRLKQTDEKGITGRSVQMLFEMPEEE